jgi:hypothetical protein
MTPADLVARLRSRGIDIGLTTTGKVRVKPRSALLPEESAYLKDNAALVAQSLRCTARLDSLLSQTRSEEEQLDAATRRAFEDCEPVSMFRTARGLLFLQELNDDEARSFAAKGKLSESEIATWWAWRHRRAYPVEVRHYLFRRAMRRRINPLIATAPSF